ncbi:hypothetical protein IV74_GL002425 [Carnobacterium divergens DSM 20623]|uniref:Uncharacterized protein n=2 Tax=Carnobacterium divergens TaxID=2748 RepID=A0A0R2HPN4_CARDV|nr:hypothetical protein IV74_GL002425 [Carnobacterium divergens DSM 20623]
MAMQLVQNGVPLVSINNGDVEVLKNTQTNFVRQYSSGTFNITKAGEGNLGINLSAGVDLASIESKVIEVKIPGTPYYVAVKVSGNIGMGYTFTPINSDGWKYAGEIGATLGFGGKVGTEFGNKDYSKDSINDFDF